MAMARGRKPQGDHPLSAAERQARYRARHAQSPAVRYRRPADRRSRHQRWSDAPGFRRGRLAELVTLQGLYTRWFEALPEPLRDTSTGEALQAIIDLDLDDLLAAEPPRGFAQD
jgi:hypothetical protein